MLSSTLAILLLFTQSTPDGKRSGSETPAPLAARPREDAVDKLKIEASGGFVGPGGSNLIKGGEVPLSALSAEHRAWAESLFEKAEEKIFGNVPAFTITVT